MICSDENLVALEHVNHILIGLLKTIKRHLEGIKTAFEAFDQASFADGSQAVAGGLSVVIKPLSDIVIEERDGLVAHI